ncbi:GNAT family N-acetyltransferase [Aquimarina rubra]|uniref:GNAT family N-acetyltransferase n=1 Tax=Aquimarina rubra TaxID=1920033 RepID=A0ABW5LA68_9FLAO
MKNAAKFHIRKALENDIPSIIRLCEKHAAFEKSEYRKKGKVKKLSEAIFSNIPKLFCLVVEVKGELVGYATYMKQYSTWDTEEYMYMDCLYLEESYRGSGIGEKIMVSIGQESKKLGCKLMQWQTPKFNERAAKFYHRIGAISKEKLRFFMQND